MQGLWFMVKGWGLGCRVQDLEFKVEGLGFEV
jgi:hypothetical protein